MQLIKTALHIGIFLCCLQSILYSQTRNLYVEGTGDQLGVIHSTSGGIAGIELVRGGPHYDWRIINQSGNFKLLRTDDNFTTIGTEDMRLAFDGTMTLFNGDDVEIGSSDGTLILGLTSGQNLAMDRNEIMARNGNLKADLFLQHGDAGNVLIGATAEDYDRKLTISHDSHQLKLTNSDDLDNKWYIGASSPSWNIDEKRLVFDDDRFSNNPILMLDGVLEAVSISTNTIPSGYKLAVGGKTICEEVMIELEAGWPDFVFDAEFELVPLLSLERKIDELGHLPDVPSAAQIYEEGGVALGSMQKILLQKIEELTLYVIELKKENIEMKAQIEKISNR